MRFLCKLITLAAFAVATFPVIAQAGDSGVNASGTLAKPPSLGSQANMYVRKAVESCNSMLSAGQFDTARELVASYLPQKETSVFVKLQLVPLSQRESYRQAVARALQMWNAVDGAPTKFSETTDEAKARIIVQFETAVVADAGTINFGQTYPQLLCDSRVNPAVSVEARDPAKPVQTVSRVAIFVQGTAETHSPQSVTHLVAKELGAYLGLADSIKSEEIMGPDLHGGIESAAISPAEIATAKEVAATTAKLLEFADKQVRVEETVAKVVIEKDTIEAGSVTRGDQVPYEFVFKNTGNIPLEINAKPNCGCTVAEYDKTIAPGQAGKLSAKINTTGFQGPIHKTITITTNDPKNAVFNLNLACTVVPVVRITPESPVTIVVNDTGITTQRFYVYAKEGEALTIQDVISPNPTISTKISPWKGVLDDKLTGEPAKERTGYAIDVNITSDQAVGRNFQALTLNTGNAKEPTAMIQLILEKGIVFQPQAVYMGVVDPTPAQQVDRIVTITKKGGQFNIVKVQPDDPNIVTQLTTVTQGKEYRLTITYKGGWSSGFVNKKVTITTDDPKQTSLVVPVQASVRATTGTGGNAP